MDSGPGDTCLIVGKIGVRKVDRRASAAVTARETKSMPEGGAEQVIHRLFRNAELGSEVEPACPETLRIGSRLLVVKFEEKRGFGRIDDRRRQLDYKFFRLAGLQCFSDGYVEPDNARDTLIFGFVIECFMPFGRRICSLKRKQNPFS